MSARRWASATPADRAALRRGHPGRERERPRSALLVDAIQGQRQVVIKSLEANYQHVDGIAAATILGDGRVALILDVDALVAAAPPRRGTRPKSTLAIAS